MSDSTSRQADYTRAYAPRSQYWTGVGLTAVMSALSGAMLWRGATGSPSWPLPLTLFVGLVTLAMVFGLVISVRNILYPPLMFEATPKGIDTFLDTRSRRYTGIGKTIPWQAILGIEPFEATTQSGSTRLRVRALRVSLHPNHELPIEQMSILRPSEILGGKEGGGIDWDATIFLDAITDVGPPAVLAARFEGERRRLVERPDRTD